MNAEQLKDFIKEDISRIEKLLESIGCHKIWRTGSEVRCAPPDLDNHTSISVNIDSLYCSYYRREGTWRGDIIKLVQLVRKEGFSQSFRFIKSIFGLSGKFSQKKRRDPLGVFKGIRKQHRIVENLDDLEVEKFGLEVLERFVLLPHINLFYEGIMPDTAEMFKVGYCPITDRIIFPHFSYDDVNSIVGITGRTLRSNEEMKEFKIPKYWNFIKGYKKMYNLYGFSHSLQFVIKNKMLIIFEAEKSVQKHWTQTRNEGFSCSVGGHEISDMQVKIVLKYTPPDVEVVIAFDRDVQDMKDDDGKSIGEDFLINQCNKFSRFRKVSYIWDTYDLLGKTDAPIDKGYKIFNYLLKYRKSVN